MGYHICAARTPDWVRLATASFADGMSTPCYEKIRAHQIAAANVAAWAESHFQGTSRACWRSIDQISTSLCLAETIARRVEAY